MAIGKEETDTPIRFAAPRRQIIEIWVCTVVVIVIGIFLQIVMTRVVVGSGVAVSAVIFIITAFLILMIWRQHGPWSLEFQDEHLMLRRPLRRTIISYSAVQMILLRDYSSTPNNHLILEAKKGFGKLLRIMLQTDDAWHCFACLRQACPHASGLGPADEEYPPLDPASRPQASRRMATHARVSGVAGILAGAICIGIAVTILYYGPSNASSGLTFKHWMRIATFMIGGISLTYLSIRRLRRKIAQLPHEAEDQNEPRIDAT